MSRARKTLRLGDGVNVAFTGQLCADITAGKEGLGCRVPVFNVVDNTQHLKFKYTTVGLPGRR
eukprot:SAG22_NODE_20119_length_268_cov_0.911243_1_plen_62_part_10